MIRTIFRIVLTRFSLLTVVTPFAQGAKRDGANYRRLCPDLPRNKLVDEKRMKEYALRTCRFQFSAKSLLALVAVIGIATSVLALVIHNCRAKRIAIHEVESLGAGISWEEDASLEPSDGSTTQSLFGEHLFSDVIWVDLSNRDIADSDLWHLLQMKKLEMLWLTNTRVSDQSVAYLGQLTNLKELHVENTQLTDSGVNALRKLLPKCSVVD